MCIDLEYGALFLQVFMFTYNWKELTNTNMTGCRSLSVNTTFNRMGPEIHSISA